MVRVVLFSGGRGSGVLSRQLLKDPQISLTLAINGYTDKNRDRLDQARKDLAALAKRMSPAQISEAERRVKAFKPTP